MGKYRGMDTKDLHWPMINPPRLLWIEGSPYPHKAKGHHGPSHIGPLIKLHQGKRKGRLLKRCPYAQLISQRLGNNGKESCGFPEGHLMEQIRGRCRHILALAKTRTALQAWREDSGDITRILLTTMAGLLAQQGVRISDTITICTRILLAAWNLHKIDHGGSSGTGSTRGSRWEENIAESLSCSRQGRIDIL